MIKNIDFNLIDVITLNQEQNIDNQALDRALSYASYLDREIHYILDFIVRNLKENKVEITHPQGKKIKNITALVGAEENKAYFYDGFTKIDAENLMIVEDYSNLNLRKNAQWWNDFKAQLEDLNATEPCPKME